MKLYFDRDSLMQAILEAYDRAGLKRQRVSVSEDFNTQGVTVRIDGEVVATVQLHGNSDDRYRIFVAATQEPREHWKKLKEDMDAVQEPNEVNL